MAKTAPYGSWKSPITSDLIVAQSIALTEVRLDGGALYWLEGRPQEQGRFAVVRASADGATAELTPKPFNVRTRVHEYGGGAWAVADGTVYFSNFADGRLYRQAPGAGAPEPLTAAPPSRERDWRFADGIIDRRRRCWIGIREDHTGDGEPVNTIVAVDLDRPGADAGRVLVDGHDFFASPRLAPDGSRLLWLAWDHPDMPWNGTTLYVAGLADDGTLSDTAQAVAGGRTESVFQPEWSPDGSAILFVSDRSGWWNLYGFDLAAGAARAIAPRAAEFGQPQWVFGLSTYAFAGPERIVTAYCEAGLWHLAAIEPASGSLRQLELPFTEIGSVRAERDLVVFRGAAPTLPGSIVALDLHDGRHRVLKQSTDLLEDAELRIGADLTRVEPVAFPTTGQETAYGLFYPPHNSRYCAPAGERPPLLVRCHGGPTSAASSALSLAVQYWTSRGIAVLDVNYRGSTGFGRAYRDRLNGNWGVVDVDDCINGARFLIERGAVDGERIVISGGSAGGYKPWRRWCSAISFTAARAITA